MPRYRDKAEMQSITRRVERAKKPAEKLKSCRRCARLPGASSAGHSHDGFDICIQSRFHNSKTMNYHSVSVDIEHIALDEVGVLRR